MAGLRGDITLVDTVAKTTHRIYSEPGRLLGSLAFAPGGRRLYFKSDVTEADIWLMRFDRDDPR